MGHSVVWLNESLPVIRQNFEGQPSTILPELEAIRAALTSSPGTEDVVILTDSLGSLQNLRALQRRDFHLSIRTHPNSEIFRDIVTIINSRAASGAHTTIAKITAHRGNPLNEWANQEAGLAATADDSRTSDRHPYNCHYLLPENIGPKHYIKWGPRLKRYGTQKVAEMFFCERNPGSSTAVQTISGRGKQKKMTKVEQFLSRAGENREYLGAWMSTSKDFSKVRDVLLACACWHGNSKLYQWKCRPSPHCSLCSAANETDCHIQCICPQLQRPRIAAHHGIWVPVFQKIESHLPHSCTSLLEAPMGTWDQIEIPPRFSQSGREWKQCVVDLSAEDFEEEEEMKHHFLISLLKGLWFEISLHPTNVRLWRQIITSCTELANMVDMNDIVKACDKAARAEGIYGNLIKHEPILAAIERMICDREECNSSPGRMRPDGLVVNWSKKIFFLLEFTRAYDQTPEFNQRADSYKIGKYTGLCKLMQSSLGSDWTGCVLPFTAGVRGSINHNDWTRSLSKLGLSRKNINLTIRHAAQMSLEQCPLLYKARQAALKSFHTHNAST